jgi:hypothetical protein
LTAQYILAKQRNIEYVLDKEKIPFLAKALVIRTKWPDLYKALESRILRTSDSIEEVLAWFTSNGINGSNGNHQDFLEFIATTHQISDPRASIFFSLKETPEQKKVPEWESFISAAENIDIESLGKIYEKVAVEERIPEFQGLLSAYMRHNENKLDKLINIFISVHSLISGDTIKIFDSFLARIFDLIRPESFIPVVDRIDFSKIFNEQFASLPKTTRNIVATKYIDFLNALASRPEELNKNISPILALFALATSDNAWPVFKDFSTELTRAKNNVLQHLKSNLVFPAPIGENEKKTLDNLLEFMAIERPTSITLYEQTLWQLFFLLQYPHIQPNYLEDVLSVTLRFLKRTKVSEFTDDLATNQLKALSGQLVSLYNSYGDWNRRGLIVKNLLKVRFSKNPLLPDINNCIKNFIEDINNSSENIINAISDETLFKDDAEIRGDLIRRSFQAPDLLIKLGIELNEDEKCQVVNNLNGRPLPPFLGFLEYIKYQFEDQFQGNPRFKNDVVRNTINRYTAVSDEATLNKWLVAIKSVGLPADAADAFFNNLKVLMGQNENFKKAIKEFIGNNERLLAESQMEELVKA